MASSSSTANARRLPSPDFRRLARGLPALILLLPLGVLSAGCAGAATKPSALPLEGAEISFVHANKPLQPGQHPDFLLPIVSGAQASSLQLSKQQGKVVIVDFWASWCAPCREAMPFYEALASSHPQGLLVLGVNVDEDESEMKAAMQARPVSFPILRDAHSEVVEGFGVNAMPTSFIFDKKGGLVKVHRGFVPSDREALTKLIETLIAQ